MTRTNESLIEFDDFSFDREKLFLRKREQPVPLKKQSAEVLALLLANAGEVVSRDEIREHVWKNRLIEFDQGINACIRDIRQALDDDSRDPRFVETHPRIGYRFSAAISTPAHRRAATKLRWLLAMGVVSLALIAWALGAFGPLRPPAPPPMDAPRIAVMPFKAMDDLAESAAKANRLTDLFVVRLSESQSQALVISANDLFGDDREKPGMGDVSRWLEADYILAGAVQEVHGTAMVSLRLIRTDGYVHLWTKTIPLEAFEEHGIEQSIPQIVAALNDSG